MFDFKTPTPGVGEYAALYSRMRFDSTKEPDVVDFGVAEMKFPLCPAIRSAMERISSFGYPSLDAGYTESVQNWMQTRHNWTVEREWLIQTYGLVAAIGYCIRALTNPEDGIVVCFPSYGPFRRTVLQNGRTLVESDLIFDGERYVMNFEELERHFARPEVKAFILCNPHNPTGRVWTKAELTRLGELCCKYDILVISDDIHFDLVYKPHVHTVFAGICPAFADRTVTLTAPSKTFNIAGMTISNVVVSNPALREPLAETIARDMGGYHNVLGLAACQAAYTDGTAWCDALLPVLEHNVDLMLGGLKEILPGVRFAKPEGTYLCWVDMACIGLEGDELTGFLHEKARFLSQRGIDFGNANTTFQRINVACPESYITAALARLKAALDAR